MLAAWTYHTTMSTRLVSRQHTQSTSFVMMVVLGDTLNPDSPSGMQPNTDGGDTDIPGASSATEHDSG